MKSLEQNADSASFDFSLNVDNFDVNAAFQEAIYGVITNAEIALEEKVRRMEIIVSEGTSDIYRGFVDFRQMASQIEMFCSHDHGLNQLTQVNDTLSGFMHDHADTSHDEQRHHSDKNEAENKATKKKKKKRTWFELLLARF